MTPRACRRRRSSSGNTSSRRRRSSASLTVDGKSVPMDKSGAIARLPRLDMKHPHLIAGEMKFEDGFVTRREMVVGGEVTDTADAEMTPVGVRQTGAAPANLGDCFTSGGAPMRVGRGREFAGPGHLRARSRSRRSAAQTQSATRRRACCRGWKCGISLPLDPGTFDARPLPDGRAAQHDQQLDDEAFPAVERCRLGRGRTDLVPDAAVRTVARQNGCRGSSRTPSAWPVSTPSPARIAARSCSC